MNKAILIVGLPGSGKTHLAKAKYVSDGYILIDDPNVLPTKDGILFKNVVVADPHLCREDVRNNCIRFFEDVGYTVECIFFENSPEKCRKLIELRNDGRIIGDFRAYNYTIPEGVEVLKIYEP